MQRYLSEKDFIKYFTHSFFFKDSVYLLLEGRGGRKREKHQCVVASCAPPTGDPAEDPDMYPDQKWNQQTLASQVRTQLIVSHQTGLH